MKSSPAHTCMRKHNPYYSPYYLSHQEETVGHRPTQQIYNMLLYINNIMVNCVPRYTAKQQLEGRRGRQSGL